MRTFASACVAIGIASACNKAVPEPAPTATTATSEVRAATTSSTAPAVATASTGRCITKVPTTPPVIPPPADPSRCPVDPEPATKLPLGEVTFPEAPSSPRVDAELVKSDHDVEKGLMYRRSMADDRGMLFKLDGRYEHKFWMRNTCIALDMLFIDDDGTIVGIVEGAAPLTESTRTVGCPSVFVLEVNGGWTRKRGVLPGQKVTIPFSAR